MNSVAEVITALQAKGSAQTRKIYARHGAPDEMFGVKVADLKAIAKQINGDQQLALQLYKTGNSDAMYLAGIVADGGQMTKGQLDAWAKGATWYMLAEYTVPGVAAESKYGQELALKWMKSKKEMIASAGWATYANLLSILPDDQLDLGEVKQLLERAVEEIHTAPNRVRYAMNNFVIATGAYVEPLLKQAKAAAQRIGLVEVEMGETSCKVPLASDYIAKVESMGRVGRKRRSAKC